MTKVITLLPGNLLPSPAYWTNVLLQCVLQRFITMRTADAGEDKVQEIHQSAEWKLNRDCQRMR